MELGNKLSNLTKVIESQEKEIDYFKEENKQLRDLCINHSSSSSLCPMGPNKANCNGDAGPSMNTKLTNASKDKCPKTFPGEIGIRENVTLVAECQGDDIQQNTADQSSGNSSTSNNDLKRSYSYVVMRSPVNIEVSPNESATYSNSNTARAIDLTGNDNATENMQSSTCTVDVGTDAGFTGVKRNRVQTKRYFVSEIAENVNKDMILQYLDKKGVNPTLINLFSSKRKGTLSAKLNLRAVDSKRIQEDEF